MSTEIESSTLRICIDVDGMERAITFHLADYSYYLDQCSPGQRKELIEAVVLAVTVEGPSRARLQLDLPIRPLGKFDRQGSKWRPVWRPQRDKDPNGIPTEFVIAIDRGGPPAPRLEPKQMRDGQKRSKG